MKTVIRRFKDFLRTNVVTGKLYKNVTDRYDLYRIKRHKEKKRQNLQREGVKIIENVQKLLESTGYTFFFDMGTLLGIVREGRLLKHDMDIDIAVVVNSEEDKIKLCDILTTAGMQEQFRFTVDELGIIEQSFLCRSVKFDINYYYTDDNDDVCYLMYRNPEKHYLSNEMDVVRLTCPHITATEKINFSNIKINAPINAENYLAVRYGENWRIPDKNYIYWKGPSTHPTDYVGHQTVFVEEKY